MCFCYLNHHFVTTVKVGWKLVSDVCEHMNYWKRLFSNCFDVLNPNIKSFLLLVEWKIIKHKTISFLLCEPSFCYCCKIGWELVSDVWEYMNYWKRVFSNCYDVLNPNIKSFLLLVKWKIIKHKIICFLLLEPSFYHCCTVGWKLVYVMWEHMN